MLPTLVAMSATLSAHAVPTLFNKCNKVVKSVPNGAGVYFSHDCAVAYVLPPTAGGFEMAAYSPTTHLEECGMVQSYYGMLNSAAKSLADLTEDSGSSKGGSILFPGNGGSGGLSHAQKIQAISEAKELAASINEALEGPLSKVGVTIQGVLLTNHDQLVQAYQKKNPGITFVAMPISAAKLYFTRKDGSESNGAQGVMSFQVNNSKVALYPQLTEYPEDEGVVFGNSLSGQLVLNLAGICPFYDVKAQKLTKSSLTSKDIAAYFTSNITYSYNLAVNRAYKASYNLASFFRRLQTSESKGGLFSSKTISRLIIEKDSHDWFKFEALSQDPNHQFEEELRATVKAELIDRVFKQIDLLSFGPGEKAPDLATPKANGAEVGAKELRKCPYMYCQVGAAVLDVANAIFGKNSAVSEFIQNNDYWATDEVTESKMLPFMGTLTFKAME